ncbi:MAG: helix-turn-helix transcriptional regulator [Verrucomicrobia bacterium]|nr:helix-turn-helix transcriptional regulator [Verrucomicrobiota bacterium]MBU1733649.1 helix-turn-helix transcriptional regulator [Verrucomicrobiota bacterium]
MNRTFVSKKGQLLKEHRVNWRVVDEFLLESLEHVPALPLDGMEINLEMAHFQPGIVPQGHKAGDHIHSTVHFQFVMEGLFRFETQRKSFLLKTGGGIVIPAKQIHCWTCERAGVLFGASIGITGQSATIFTDHVKRQGADSFLFCSNPELFNRLLRIIEITLKPVPFHWRREMIGCELMLWVAQALHTALDLRLMKTPTPCTKQAQSDPSRRLCEEAVNFVMSNFNRPINIHATAGHVGVTPRHLNRLFLRYLHETAHGFLLRTRLEYADKMLKSSPALKIKALTFASGFQSPSHFTQCFKRYFGRLPTGKT